jgi:DNA repair protein RecO
MAKLLGSTVQALVLKRSNVGETDRVVTLYSPEQGKIVCIAKGVRKMSSSKRSLLEPGNQVRAFVIPTASLGIITQVTLLSDLSAVWHDLNLLRKVSQVLEIIDKLAVEADPEAELYAITIDLLTTIANKTATDQSVRAQLDQIIQLLGYPSITTTNHRSVSSYIEEITERSLHSFEYLKVN